MKVESSRGGQTDVDVGQTWALRRILFQNLASGLQMRRPSLQINIPKHAHHRPAEARVHRSYLAPCSRPLVERQRSFQKGDSLFVIDAAHIGDIAKML